MSEDVDIKLLLTPPEKPFTKGRGDHARLKRLHAELPSCWKRWISRCFSMETAFGIPISVMRIATTSLAPDS